MGSAPSKIEEDKSLALCQERKRIIREALDGRCSLAAAHFSYAESLRNVGIALRRFAEPETQHQAESSSLYTTSTSATPELPALLTQQSGSRFNNLSPYLSQQAEATVVAVSDSLSPGPSPVSSGRFRVNRMKAARFLSKTVEEKPPAQMIATLQNSSLSPRKSKPNLENNNTAFEASPPPPGTPPWDYFGLFHPVDDRYTLDDGHNMDHTDDMRRLREEEGIPELEEELEELEGEKEEEDDGLSFKGDDFRDSEEGEEEDEFDKPSEEPLVRMFENRNLTNTENITSSDKESKAYDTGKTPARTPVQTTPVRSVRTTPARSPVRRTPARSPVRTTPARSPVRTSPARSPVRTTPARSPVRTTPVMTPPKVDTPVISVTVNGRPKEGGPYVRNSEPGDFLSCMREIEELFKRAAESGREVPRMLEADKVQFRPLLPDEIGQRLGTSTFLSSFFACCGEGPPNPQVSAPVEVKYLTWHRSVSSHSSSSRNPLGETTKDSVEGLNGNFFGGVYMNSGSHASTLDRLYAWERKLYDEVKASGAIRRKYDVKCRELRHQESRGEGPQRIDKTRASVKDLHSRIHVAIHRINKISKNIEDLRDKELQPQVEELIAGLIRMWAMMLDCHRRQLDIILVASTNGATKFTIRPESQSQATLILTNELSILYTNFTKWISSHRSYLLSINNWVHKCVSPLQQKSKKKKKPPQDSLRNYGAPPIFATCEDWLKLLDELPTKQVVEAVKDLASVTTCFLPRQEKRRYSVKDRLSFLVSQNGGSSDGLRRGEIRKNGNNNEESPVDWSLNCDSLLARLVVFLERLKKFAECSLEEYGRLQESIENARKVYNNSGQRS